MMRHVSPAVVAAALAAAGLTGCGTTSSSDTKRTATEQLLVSDAIERAVMKMDLAPLAGRKVFLDTTVLANVEDKDYLTSAIRQHVLGSGCILAAKLDDAELVVEARAGALGTDRNSVMLGMPATNIEIAGNGTSIPELALIKRSDQRAVAKISLFAYHRATGTPAWQSGSEHVASHARDRWFFGAGPFQDGRVHDRMEFAGEKISSPWAQTIPDDEEVAATFDLTRQQTFTVAPPAGSGPAATADRRPVNLPPVR
jgi:hypothetical protein